MTIPTPASPPAAASPDWASVRARFPAASRWTYLDLARKAILPDTVGQAMAEWLADVDEAGGKRAFSMDEIEAARADVARVFGAPADRLAFVKNTSEGINIVAQGLDWQPGDNLVISTEEHENNTFPWRPLADRGVEVRIAQAGADGMVSVDDYRALVDGRTRVVAVAWVTYGLGQRADLAAFADLCRSRDILLVVDAVQGLGILADPIGGLGADVVAAGGHKAQFSLAGAGLFHVSDRALDRLRPTYAAKYSFDTLDRTVATPALAPDAHRFEYGNPNFLGIWVQRRSALLIESWGRGHVEARIRDLTTRAIEGARERGIAVATPADWKARAGIVSFRLGGADADRIESWLGEDGIRAAAKDDRIRIAPHVYNDEGDIDRFLDRLSFHLRRNSSAAEAAQ
ncbi:selenocysteine lyase/cysteine desulfurase [Stella humosa]|uniref:Selenocysteine lyase/cysteine desulfurase n=1 Tax=Stella humosa TaxID=94 RepID=A0A3N1L183_9PROT|nr:aminotransferase class V-fold PLP-dependent enzyme [Stella humosa]ROP84358.1 selenocysteine lyase/cysteine desulfurase [Stella humosa]BBK33873.1 cysteine desulfurase [Stella humosa]